MLAGDIDSRPGWPGYRLFAGWPVPVFVVAGNHEFDGRDVDAACDGLHALCGDLGFTLLERDTALFTGADGRTVRIVGTARWSDFDLFGAAQRERAQRAAAYFMRLMASTRGGREFDAESVRAEALACRAWLEHELAQPARGRWAATLVVTHFGPSVASADPRYGRQPGTASFCNADDDLIARTDVWLHGHLHCRHDYRVGRTRVVCNSRGVAAKGEPAGHDPLLTLSV